MGEIYHRLIASSDSEAGARDRFQEMVAQLVRLKHGTVRQIEPAPGDGGIDAFVGNLNDMIAVWQAKFIQAVGESQQAQIRESFSTLRATLAGQDTDLDTWVLCIPCTMDLPATKWWDAWKRRQERDHGVTIDLWDETEIDGLLLSPDAAAIRARYVPDFPAPVAAAAEFAVLPVPDDVDYTHMLFIKQLEAAEVTPLDPARRAFFNAEWISREVRDKAVDAEVRCLDNWLADTEAIWASRYNEECSTTPSAHSLLPRLHPAVMQAIEQRHNAELASPVTPPVRMALVHRQGAMHQVVESGQAGWRRDFADIARDHRG